MWLEPVLGSPVIGYGPPHKQHEPVVVPPQEIAEHDPVSEGMVQGVVSTVLIKLLQLQG